MNPCFESIPFARGRGSVVALNRLIAAVREYGYHGPHADARMGPGVAARRCRPDQSGGTAGCTLSVLARHRRRRTRLPAVRPANPNRARPCIGAVRGSGASRRRVRHVATRSARQCHSGCFNGGGRSRADHRGDRVPGMALCRFTDRRGDRPWCDRGLPPDAVAANEVLRHLRIPQRIGLVLQGESISTTRPHC